MGIHSDCEQVISGQKRWVTVGMTWKGLSPVPAVPLTPLLPAYHKTSSFALATSILPWTQETIKYENMRHNEPLLQVADAGYFVPATKWLRHLSCSLALALCDLWLFSKVKITLKDKKFKSIQDIKAARTVELKTVTKEDFQNCLGRQQAGWDVFEARGSVLKEFGAMCLLLS